MEKNELIYLVHKAQAGDKGAFETLYSEYRDKVYFFVRRFAGSGDTAEDLTSAAFTVAMERIGELKSGESFVGWLYSIAYKKCVDFLRDESRTVKVSSAAELEELLEAAALNEPILLPEDYAVNAETRAQLKEVIDSLSPDQRSAVIMYYYDEMSIPEVAAAMGTNENNVSQKLHRARKRIRSKIEKLIGSGTLFGAVPMGTLLENLNDSGMNMSSGIGLAAISAAAVAVPYGLNKASGGVANELLFITRKYWSKHKKSLAALLFSGVLLCAVVCCALFVIRGELNRTMNSYFDVQGEFDLILPEPSKELIEKLSNEKTLTGTMSVIGHAHYNDEAYEYGTISDPDELAHLYFESGGLPKDESEAAVHRGVLDRMGYTGKVGDRISLDIGEFTLSGIISGSYGTVELTSICMEATEDNRPVYPIPLIFLKSDKAPLYSLTMLKGLSLSPQEATALVYSEYEENVAYWIPSAKQNDELAKVQSEHWEFRSAREQIRKMTLLAAVIAVLSIFAVCKTVFAEREHTVALLYRIGFSKRRIFCMYAIECLLFAVIQSVIGILFGLLIYGGIYCFQVNVLDMLPYSGITFANYITDFTADPICGSVIVTTVVLPIGYALAGISSKLRTHGMRAKKPAGLRKSLSKAFSDKYIAVIQVSALVMICFGSALAYMIFTDSGKTHLNYTDYIPAADYSFGSGFDFEQDGISEYYSTQVPETVGFGSFLMTKTSENGITDETADRFEDAVCTGRLESTFLLSDNSHGLDSEIVFGSADEKALLYDNSSPVGKAFLDNLNSVSRLYKCRTVISDRQFVNSLEKYLIRGRIDTEKLSSGEEMLLVVRSDDSPLTEGQRIKVGSVLTNDSYGIDEVSLNDVTIGAVVLIPKNIDRISKHCLCSTDEYNLLTVSNGARKLDLFGAKYTEIFSRSHIDGSLIPAGSGMTLSSYSDAKQNAFIHKATQYGGMILIVFILSLLGFAAYFNGIGLKIRQKEYQISVLRAVGTPLARLRRKLMFDSIKLPMIASVVAFAGVKTAAFISSRAYEKYTEMYISTFEKIPDEYKSNISAYQDEMRQKLHFFSDRYFIHNEIWLADPVIPTLIVFLIMCTVTVLLTRHSFKMFTPDIAGALARGRKRR